MDTNDFFIERDEEDKKPNKKAGDPKTTMFEKNNKGHYEEPKTTIFNAPSKPAKPSYEFIAPTEAIPNTNDKVSSEKTHQIKKEKTVYPATAYQPIFNSGKIVSKNKSHKGFLTGFLVSFSRDPNGEYWVLRQGKNTIGSDRSNDIILPEKNISDQHAVLNIRRSKKDNRLMFAIVDMCSEEGTLVNGEDIEFTTTELSTGDKIMVGGYELLLLSFDKDQQSLTTNNAFNDASKNSSMRWQDLDYSAGNPSESDDNTRITP